MMGGKTPNLDTLARQARCSRTITRRIPARRVARRLSPGKARCAHRVYVDGLWMDATEVTNEQFSKFIEATNYVTVAERTPRAEDFPGAPPENLVAGAVVFAPPSHPVPLNDHFQWWSYAKGANWRHPEGPASSIAHRDRYPVVQALPEAPNPVVARLLDRHLVGRHAGDRYDWISR